MVISQEDGVSKKQLMLSAAELENTLKEKERIGREINIEQSRVVGNDNYSRDMSSQAGNENWREKHIRKAMEECACPIEIVIRATPSALAYIRLYVRQFLPKEDHLLQYLAPVPIKLTSFTSFPSVVEEV
ncbi:hypothetical protein WN943_006635 [Citrus x changshan-huyou]